MFSLNLKLEPIFSWGPELASESVEPALVSYEKSTQMSANEVQR